MTDTPDHFPVDVLRLLNSWCYKLLNLKMGYKTAHDDLREETREVQDAVREALWFHMGHAIKNRQSGEWGVHPGLTRLLCVCIHKKEGFDMA